MVNASSALKITFGTLFVVALAPVLAELFAFAVAGLAVLTCATGCLSRHGVTNSHIPA